MPDGNPEWHVNVGGSLCYVLNEQWCDFLRPIYENDSDLLIEVASRFCIDNVRYLLVRHLEAYRYRLTHWDPVWPAWAHGSAGLRDYRQSRGEQEFRRHRSKTACRDD